jgi:hypothetical protein
MHATTRLAHLLELADKGPALRAALAEELADLLTDWPADCPKEMRGACEALLARAAREVDVKIRARLRVRLYADPALAARVLPRDESETAKLIDAARKGEDLLAPLARAWNLPPIQVKDILADSSGHALAVACKGAKFSRAAFSALTVLTGGQGDIVRNYGRLDRYDAVDSAQAEQVLQSWRAGAVPHAA